MFYRRYVDDIFVLFRKEEHLKLFLNYINSCPENIKFTSEKETNNKLSFLDIKYQETKISLSLQFIVNPHLVEYFSHFDSLIPRSFKFNLVSTLIFRYCSICCRMELFHEEVMQLKEIFEKNRYDNKFFNKCL